VPIKESQFLSLIKVAVQNNASDVHIRSNESPTLRIHSKMVPIQSKALSQEDLIQITSFLTNGKFTPDEILSFQEMDGGYEVPGVCRLRYNFFRYLGNIGIVLRIVNLNIPSLESLNMPECVGKLALQHRGLVCVTGPTGSGKSTTLASMIDYINENRNAHVVTIEDPIEYIYQQKKCRISQREIGNDTESFATALRAALRQDPDIILIGEMRDAETISIALKAAETGHMVFSTIHTTDAVKSIGRIIAMFPPEEQEEVRKRLAENLRGSISQRMLKKEDGQGVVIAMEVMISTPGVRECILGESPLTRIHNIIEDGAIERGGNGSQSFNQHIKRLYDQGIISKQTATENVSSESDFLQSLTVD
jgi:twitching motility protein PilT